MFWRKNYEFKYEWLIFLCKLYNFYRRSDCGFFSIIVKKVGIYFILFLIISGPFFGFISILFKACSNLILERKIKRMMSFYQALRMLEDSMFSCCEAEGIANILCFYRCKWNFRKSGMQELCNGTANDFLFWVVF